MNEKKNKGKQAWCLNTVAILKPYVERKEHITRSTAGRLVKPVTNWQRRELDTLRKQANQIIRGENVSPLTYTVFGMTLEHPEMKPVAEAFDNALAEHRKPFLLPSNLMVRGVQSSEHAVFHDNDFGRRTVNGGDVWVIRHEDGSCDTMFIENDQTYVLIKDTLKFPPTQKVGYRCIYPECVIVEEVALVGETQMPERPSAPPPADLVYLTKAYALSKEPERGDCYKEDGCLIAWTGTEWLNVGKLDLPGEPANGPITLNWVANIQTMADLPDAAKIGDMYGIYNGRTLEVDVYMVWTPQGAWCELMQNTRTEESIRTAKLKSIAEHFGIKLEEELYAKITQPVKSKYASPEQLAYYAGYAGVNRAVFIKELPTYGYLREQGVPGEVFDIADQEDIGIATVGWAGDDWVDVTDLTRTVPHKRYRSYNDQAPVTLDEHRHVGSADGETTGPAHVKRVNPTEVVYVADDETTIELDHKLRSSYGFSSGNQTCMWNGEVFIKVGKIWMLLFTSGKSAKAASDIEGSWDQTFEFISLEQFKTLSADDYRPGLAYVDQADHIQAWVNNEWTDMGPFHHNLGLKRNERGEVWYKRKDDIIADMLGIRPNFVDFIEHWGELPAYPALGDMYTILNDAPGFSMNSRSAVWDGEVWIDRNDPTSMITLPLFTPFEFPVAEAPAEADWKFEEPKPNPTGFWARLGRLVGFK
ncbi:hypothetical protein pEaSNUABM37_00026 [Erwinia phage pEa_SNUABM_37]|nr:hypothetical protein pEaSNUABM37_00026 [Erwinia phage pEa_SNUABM_37]QXO10496.1 hypothetical protein pEaSNUABM48_00026 [Erwinia phage pEa_SNUABM_48]